MSRTDGPGEAVGKRSRATSALVRLTDFGPLAVGALAIVAGTAAGWDADVLQRIVQPPQLIRAVLAGTAAALGVMLLGRALDRLGVSGPGHGRGDVASMIRGVRFAFLAVAAFAAAAGWLLAHPLPIIVALIIAGVDVIETSFLLLVVLARRLPD